MTLLATLLLTPQSPATAADFFPLVTGERRVYEVKTDEKVTLIDEVGKPGSFDGADAYPILQKSQFNQVLSTLYYRVDGPWVYLVGTIDERTADAKQADGKTIDLTKPRIRRSVLMQIKPAMPIFKYDGKPTTWTYGEIPMLTSVEDTEPIRQDETAIKGSSKLGPAKTVLGRKVETLEVRAEVQLGIGNLAQHIVETSVYGRGIGLIEAVRKESGGGKKPSETRTTLVGIEKA